jgi:hypothetical protein
MAQTTKRFGALLFLQSVGTVLSSASHFSTINMQNSFGIISHFYLLEAYKDTRLIKYPVAFSFFAYFV